MTTEIAAGRTATDDPEPADMAASSASVGTTPALDIVIPVYNEAHTIAHCVETLHAYLEHSLGIPARITIADNASTDDTLTVARALAGAIDGVRVVHLDAKGRGRALRRVWAESDASVLVYMDVDLSTDLKALHPLVAPLLSGHSDLAIGTRLGRGAKVVRGPKREFISRGYNLLLHTALRVRFSDAQCGFKAIRTDVARQLLPLVEDGEWFFDTELLVLAERAGLRIHEVPVDWTDDPDSRVDIVDTVKKDLRGVVRVGRALGRGALPLDEVRRALGREEPHLDGVPRGMIGQLARFALVGIASTIAYALLYLLLHPIIGAQAANFAALLITAVANIAANRSFTFGVSGRAGAARHHAQGLVVFFVTWGLTAGSLFALGQVAPHASRELQLAVLVVANLVATVTRFLGMRLIFRTANDAT
ncbi:glycosyltransferase [Tsukamurella sputi]|uniref:glycosyltransferase n=1 Tax=Tsukamurella sputi TaxID=2591848 RepID=UPI001878E724